MRTQSLSLAALCLCLTGTSLRPALADAASDARKAIEANYQKMAAALSKKDAVGYSQFFAKDFVKISKDGQHKDRDESAEDMKAGMKQWKNAKFTIKIVKFALQEGKATVDAQLNMSVSAPDPKTGKLSKVTVDALSTFLWVHSGTAWKIKQSKEVSTKITVDGKPLGGTAK